MKTSLVARLPCRWLANLHLLLNSFPPLLPESVSACFSTVSKYLSLYFSTLDKIHKHDSKELWKGAMTWCVYLNLHKSLRRGESEGVSRRGNWREVAAMWVKYHGEVMERYPQCSYKSLSFTVRYAWYLYYAVRGCHRLRSQTKFVQSPSIHYQHGTKKNISVWLILSAATPPTLTGAIHSDLLTFQTHKCLWKKASCKIEHCCKSLKVMQVIISQKTKCWEVAKPKAC